MTIYADGCFWKCYVLKLGVATVGIWTQIKSVLLKVEIVPHLLQYC